MTLEDRPWYRLTAHFFVGLFDFGVLSDAGSDAFKRVLIGIIAAMLTLGLLLARIVGSAASGRVAAALPAAPYRIAIETLVIAIPMVIVAFAALLVSQSLFPDETDFRVLLVLPVSRWVVFLSKALALALFSGIFIVAAHLAMLPLFLLISSGGQQHQILVTRLAAHTLASVGGSAFVVLAVMGIHGALLAGVPRAHLQVASSAVRSTMLCALVLCLPLVGRLPTIAPLLAAGSPSLYLAPPVWFLAVEELLLGHASPYFMRLALMAAAAFLVSLMVTVGSYLFLYTRFDRVMLRPGSTQAGSRGRRMRRIGSSDGRRSQAAAIRAFTRLTLQRSSLHQGVFIAIAACGAGLVLNSVIGLQAMPRLRRSYHDELAAALTWAPFTLMSAMTVAVRAALVLPIEPRANWVFRMTEHEAARVEQIDAVVGAMVTLGVIVPLAILFPAQWMVFGARAIAGSVIAGLAGLILVEIEMREWRRIPFTCSYMPGKRFVGLTALAGFAAFVVFASIGSLLCYASRSHPIGGLVVMSLLAAVAWLARRRRNRLMRYTPLLFEDILPNEVEPLRLSVY